VDALTLAALARSVGVNPETIRYYERRGLLAPPPRTASGYRQYSALDRERLALIRRAKDLGFTLAEIADLVGDGPAGSLAGVRAAVAGKLAEVGRRRAALDDQERRLRALLAACESGAAGCGTFTLDATPCTEARHP
jgi:DNA-binding transcriptional MerR regulator